MTLTSCLPALAVTALALIFAASAPPSGPTDTRSIELAELEPNWTLQRQ